MQLVQRFRRQRARAGAGPNALVLPQSGQRRLSGTLTRAESLSFSAACTCEPKKGACEVYEIRIFCLTVLALLLPAVAVAQAPPSTKTPVAPKTEQGDPKCAESGTQTTVGKGGEFETQRLR